MEEGRRGVMVHAELRGKLGIDGTRAHDRAEDLLTSTVFGLLRYLPLQEGLLSLLARARPVQLEEDSLDVRAAPGWIELEGVTQAELMFWPDFGTFGEPDLLIELRNADRLIHLVLIEAKLFSPKSGTAEAEEAERDQGLDTPSPDQLVKYWQGLQQRARAANPPQCTLIYLTARSMPPQKELRESLEKRREMRLSWLSWRDAWVVANQQALQGTSLPAQDLATLLAHKGFSEFTGFSKSESLAADWVFPANFWRAHGFFLGPPPPQEATERWRELPHFWRER
jgi:hypothetical protein